MKIYLIIVVLLVVFSACDDHSIDTSNNTNNTNNTNNANNTNNTNNNNVNCTGDAPLANLQDGVCAGVTKVCDSGNWVDPDYSLVTGYQVTETLCDNIDNDCNGTIDASPCDTNAFCDDSGGSPACMCNSGYSGNGTTCSDLNECIDGTHNCDQNAICSNTEGDYTCSCIAGYSGDGVTCTDKNECTDGTNNCNLNGTCTNVDGGFTCACNNGFSGDGVICADNNECIDETHNCDANATCANIDGGFTCTCNTYFTGDGFSCTDTNECTDGTNNCSADALCTNTALGFDCSCNTGFNGNGFSCTDINECTVLSHDCDENAACANIPGSFTCTCIPGYSGDGVTCGDQDECAEGLDNCDPDGSCTNSVGSFSCACPTYSIDQNGDGTACEFYETCQELLEVFGSGPPDGAYTIDPDGFNSGFSPFGVYCDMTTQGGGWTIVYSTTGANNEVPMTSNIAQDGNAFSGHFNLNKTQKKNLSALSNSSIFVRHSGEWLRASHELFDSALTTTNQEAAYDVYLTASDGSKAFGNMGWSNYNISGGGDYHITEGYVDYHSTDYYHLNSDCDNHYLYSYSNADQDGDAGYDVHLPLGDWASSSACVDAEGGSLQFYAAMRNSLPASCMDIIMENKFSTSGIYSVDPDNDGLPEDVYCNMDAEGGGWTLVANLEDGDVFNGVWGTTTTGTPSLTAKYTYAFDLTSQWGQMMMANNDDTSFFMRSFVLSSGWEEQSSGIGRRRAVDEGEYLVLSEYEPTDGGLYAVHSSTFVDGYNTDGNSGQIDGQGLFNRAAGDELPDCGGAGNSGWKPYGGSNFFSVVCNPSGFFSLWFREPQFKDNFETATLGSEWTTYGNADWFVSNISSIDGMYSVKSGVLGNNQSTHLALDVECLAGAYVKFSFSVSTEWDGDFLRFYVDASEKDSWSGSTGGFRSYSLSEGTHTLQWSYIKNVALFGGIDTTIIDNIEIIGCNVTP
jgi:EGF domain/Fibrinogen beta and gamma chains, C-terminal globular domain/Calcium-binding EGF domain